VGRAATGVPRGPEQRAGRDGWLFAILAVSLALGLCEINWGLPNGNASWAADALGPLTVLSIARRSVATFNSGWFYFKYPLGYPLVLLVANAPYLVLLMLTGNFKHPQPAYPYGFAHPETALYVMGLVGRMVSVAAITATVGLTYGIGRRLFSRVAGLLAAAFAATAYPLVYYAHTTNLDAVFLFWQTLALWATTVAAQTGKRAAFVVLGIAAAMAVSTKEQAFALLLPLPIIVTIYRWQMRAGQSGLRGWRAAVRSPGTLACAVAAVVTVVLVNNVPWNPSGFVNRILYLSGRSIPGVSARLAPVEFALFKGGAKEYKYLEQLFDAVESSLGWPLLVAALSGAGYVAVRHVRWALLLLTPALAHYYLSLRTLDLITLRYVLPLLVIGSVCAGALCAAMLQSKYRGTAAVAVGVLCLVGAARAIELDLLLRDDTRYRAEAWMRDHVASGSAVETYQKPAYLPRFNGLNARLVPLAERTIEGVMARSPALIVTSSAAKEGITHRWNADWRKEHALLVAEPRAVEFLTALESGALPYRAVARFTQQPRILRTRITSLCPEIVIYERATPPRDE
jgi:hypothetical protein